MITPWHLSFLCTYVSVCFSWSFSLTAWMLSLIRNIYCSPIPSGVDLFSSDLKKKSPLYSFSFLLYFIFDHALFFVIHSFVSFPFVFHLLAHNQPSSSSLASLSSTATVSCISRTSHIFLFCHLCGPVLLMYYHFCAKLASLLDSLAPEAEGSISWVLDANPVSCWVTDFLFSQMTPALCTGEVELN